MTTLKPKSSKTHTSKTGGRNKHTPMSKQAMFSKISSRGDDIIDGLFELAFECRQTNIRLGALKTLINKILPDLKVTELQGNEEKPLGVVILPQINEQSTNNLEVPPRPADTSIKTDRV